MYLFIFHNNKQGEFVQVKQLGLVSVGCRDQDQVVKTFNGAQVLYKPF